MMKKKYKMPHSNCKMATYKLQNREYKIQNEKIQNTKCKMQNKNSKLKIHNAFQESKSLPGSPLNKHRRRLLRRWDYKWSPQLTITYMKLSSHIPSFRSWYSKYFQNIPKFRWNRWFRQVINNKHKSQWHIWKYIVQVWNSARASCKKASISKSTLGRSEGQSACACQPVQRRQGFLLILFPFLAFLTIFTCLCFLSSATRLTGDGR